jgi:hypothetical protein
MAPPGALDAPLERALIHVARLRADVARLEEENATLHARFEAAEHARDAAMVERDLALARLRDAQLRSGFECCATAMREAQGRHCREAHADPVVQGTPANDSASGCA